MKNPVDFTQSTGGIINEERTIQVSSSARIAVYDDMLSAPRIVDVQPQSVHEFIEAIASAAYDLSRQQGGILPYTVIREIVENFIHAGFLECTVSILDDGNTLRFADQGPGIQKKDLVLQPGVSSATHAMKDYIRGVGSGFPIVREYLATSHGYMSIEDNAEEGVVVTISLVPSPVPPSSTVQQEQTKTLTAQTIERPSLKHDSLLSEDTAEGEGDLATVLSTREEHSLLLLHEQGMLGPVDLAHFLGVSAPTATRLLQRLEMLGMVESTRLKKRILSNAGMAYIQGLLMSGDKH